MLDEAKIKYVLMDPTKNITALVIDDVPIDTYKEVAQSIMKNEPLVEQVGFITIDKNDNISLRMAGDEFCGNATMSVAAYHSMKTNVSEEKIKISVYGISDPIEVDIKEKSNSIWEGLVQMPKPTAIKDVENGQDSFPVVFFPNIAHVIVEISDEKELINIQKEDVNKKIKEWQKILDMPAVGIMYYDKILSSITPIVYVKSVDTVFWESSCASGTVAVGAYLSHKGKDKININVLEPCGEYLKVIVTNDNALYLKGKVKYIGEYETFKSKI